MQHKSKPEQRELKERVGENITQGEGYYNIMTSLSTAVVFYLTALVTGATGLYITIKAFPSTEVKIGEPLTLRCTASGIPPPYRDMDCSLHWHRTPTEEPAPTQDVVATRIYQALGVSDQIASSLVIDEFRDSLSGRYTCLLTCGEALGSTSADIYQKEKASKFRREKGVVGTENLVGIVVVVCSVLVCAGLVLFLTRPAAPSVPRGRRPGLTTLAAAVENGGLEQNGQTPDIPPSYSFVYPSTEATSGGNESSPTEGAGSTNRQSASRDRRKITSTESLETEACSTPSSSTTLPPDYTHALNELKAQGLVSSPLILATPPPAYESVGPGVRGGGYVPVNLESDEPVTPARGNHWRS